MKGGGAGGGGGAVAPFGWAAMHMASCNVAQRLMHVGSAAPSELLGPHAASAAAVKAQKLASQSSPAGSQKMIRAQSASALRRPNQQQPQTVVEAGAKGGGRPTSAQCATAYLISSASTTTITDLLNPAPTIAPTAAAKDTRRPATASCENLRSRTSTSGPYTYTQTPPPATANTTVALAAEATRPRLPLGTKQWIAAPMRSIARDHSIRPPALFSSKGSAETTESPCAKWLLTGGPVVTEAKGCFEGAPSAGAAPGAAALGVAAAMPGRNIMATAAVTRPATAGKPRSNRLPLNPTDWVTVLAES